MANRDQNRQDKQQPDPRHADNPGSVTDQHGMEGMGPASIQGVEASDLPDGGRGPVETNIGKALSRKTPDHTGGTIGGDVGIRALPDSAEASDHGPRGKN